MTDLTSICLSFPPEKRRKTPSAGVYDKEISSFLDKLGRHDTSSSWISQKPNILEFLNPAVNSIPYAMALWKQIQAAGRDQNRLGMLFPLAIDFCRNFDPVQVRYASDFWYMVVDFVAGCLQRSQSSDMSPVVIALLRVDPSAGTFTSLHRTIVQLCLASGVPSQALPILDKNIYAFPQDGIKGQPAELRSDDHELSNAYITSKSGFTLKLEPEHVLEYYLLGAHIYIGCRNFTRARLFLEYVILSPVALNGTSFLQVEAYNKWALLGLLAEGKRYPLPKTLDGAVLKNLKILGKAYDALAENFEKRDWRKFQAEMDVGGAIWHKDGNLRLVREVDAALHRYRVIDLQKTFAALPVSMVATHLEMPPQATQPFLSDMIRAGYLDASLLPNGNDDVLRFYSTNPTSASAAQSHDLEAQTKRIADLVTFIRDADRRLQLSKEYVEYTKRAKRTNGADDPADVMDLTYDAPFTEPTPVEDAEDDEDIMAT